MHGATCEKNRVIMHVRGDESLDYKVLNPIAEIVVTHCYEAALLTLEGVAYIECCSTAV